MRAFVFIALLTSVVAQVSVEAPPIDLDESRPWSRQPLTFAPNSPPGGSIVFEKNPIYSQIARDAETPTGFERNFTALTNIVMPGKSSYLGDYQLMTYNTSGCADICSYFVHNCMSFNMYVQRRPSILPGSECLNPETKATYKCGFFNTTLPDDMLVWYGKSGFEYTNAGSNGYNRINSTSWVDI
ncbi:MAG: hypothetical protein MMC23_000431 [Stictis urceolatum]|nr:hypothetical protein [Stictis urceolata]